MPTKTQIHSCGTELKLQSQHLLAFYGGKLWEEYYCPECGITVGVHKGIQKEMDFVDSASLDVQLKEMLPW